MSTPYVNVGETSDTYVYTLLSAFAYQFRLCTVAALRSYHLSALLESQPNVFVVVVEIKLYLQKDKLKNVMV